MGEAEDVLLPAFEAAVHTEGPAWLDEIAALDGGYVPDIHGEQLPAVAKASDARLPGLRAHYRTRCRALQYVPDRGRAWVPPHVFLLCDAAFDERGMRLVSPDRIMSFVLEDAARVGLVGAAISDHPQLVGLLDTIVGSGRGVGISSLRADRVARKPEIARLLRAGDTRRSPWPQMPPPSASAETSARAPRKTTSSSVRSSPLSIATR